MAEWCSCRERERARFENWEEKPTVLSLSIYPSLCGNCTLHSPPASGPGLQGRDSCSESLTCSVPAFPGGAHDPIQDSQATKTQPGTSVSRLPPARPSGVTWASGPAPDGRGPEMEPI